MNNKFIPSDFLPIGFLGYLPYSAVPAGWLVCDGTVYSIADYPELAAKIGSTYGGDGATTFAVPDDRGLFRRGLDMSKGYDAGRVLGSEQGDAFQGHWHNFTMGLSRPYGGESLSGLDKDYNTNAYSNDSKVRQAVTDGANGTPRTANETRPKSRAYVPIIKAKNIYYDLSIQGGNAASLGGNPASYYAVASQAAKYTDFTGSFAASGYRKLPDGMIIQWGYISGVANPNAVTFPVAYSTECYAVYLTSKTVAKIYVTAGPTATGFSSASDTSSTPIYWLAIGK